MDGGAMTTPIKDLKLASNADADNKAILNLDKSGTGVEPADAAIQTHITGTGSPHTAAGVGAVATDEVAHRSYQVWLGADGLYYGASSDRAGTTSSASFAAVMNWAATNILNAGVIEIGTRRNSASTPVTYYIDAPIYIDKGVTVRGLGNYGTTIGIESGYTGEMFVVGENADVGGIVSFERIRFEGDATNANPCIDFQRCAETKLRDNEWTGFIGPSVKLDATQRRMHWNEIINCWFVGNRNTSPQITVTAASTPKFQNLLISGCHFGFFDSSIEALNVSGNVYGVQVVGCRIWRDPSKTGDKFAVFQSGTGHIVTGNSFGWFGGTRNPISFAPSGAHDFKSAVFGNVFHDSDTNANLITVAADASGVSIWGNSYGGGSATVSGANAGAGFAALGAVDFATAASVSVPAASAGGHAMNRDTADARYAAIYETQALTFDGAKAITVTAPHTVVNAAMSATATLTLNDPATATRPYTLDVVITQDGVGGRVLTLDGNVSSPGAVQPVLSAAAAAVDVLRFLWTGATWRLIGATFAQGAL